MDCVKFYAYSIPGPWRVLKKDLDTRKINKFVFFSSYTYFIRNFCFQNKCLHKNNIFAIYLLDLWNYSFVSKNPNLKLSFSEYLFLNFVCIFYNLVKQCVSLFSELRTVKEEVEGRFICMVKKRTM